MMHTLERQVLETLRKHRLTPPGTRGLVCVSGGPDSLALLLFLRAAAPHLELVLDVVHFDHGLRPESSAEAEWVAKRAAEHGLACHIVRAEHLAGRKRGVQAAARTWRRSESQRLAAQWDATWIATGHQRDDHLETLLLKLLRGAHISHLQGMAWREGRFVRPLLDIPRSRITEYLRERGVDWLEDPSNESVAYRRNRVRRELLPLLETLTDGNAQARLAALERQSAQVDALVQHYLEERTIPGSDRTASEHWIEVAAVQALPALVAARCLHDFVTERMPGMVDAAQIEQALGLLAGKALSWELHLSHGRRLRRLGDRLLLEERDRSATEAEAAMVSQRLGTWCLLAPRNWQVRGHRTKRAAQAAGGVSLYNLPPDAELLLRCRIPGDRFHPPWRERPMKLSAFLQGLRMPLWEREQVPVVVLEGQVIAIYPRHTALGYDTPRPNVPDTRALHLEISTPTAQQDA